jgi:trk system potassium uptake protein TrkA
MDRMHIIIAGCGRVGSLVARTLSSEGHDVVVVDRDPEAFERLGSAFNGLTVAGFEFDEEALRQAGIERADVFVAATNSDSANAMASLMARHVFGVERVICRIYEPVHDYPFQRLGVVTVAASALAASKIRSEVLPSGLWSDLLLADGQAEVVRFRPTCGVAGRTVGEVEEAGVFRVAALIRGLTGQEVVIPTAACELTGEELLVAVVRLDALPRLRQAFGF